MNNILVPSQRYQDSRHLLQNPKVPRRVMGFSNRAKRYTGSNYLDVDSPLRIKEVLPMHMHKEHKCATSAQKSCKPVFVHLLSVSCGLKNYINSKHLGILKTFE